MVLIRGEDEGASLFKVNNHNEKPWRVARRVHKMYAGEQLDFLLIQSFPFQVQREIVREVDSIVALRRNSPERVLQFFFVCIHSNVRSAFEPGIQASSVIEMQVCVFHTASQQSGFKS